MSDEFCTYCNDLHPMLNFGLNFSGAETVVCRHQLADALETTMPKGDYAELEAADVE